MSTEERIEIILSSIADASVQRWHRVVRREVGEIETSAEGGALHTVFRVDTAPDGTLSVRAEQLRTTPSLSLAPDTTEVMADIGRAEPFDVSDDQLGACLLSLLPQGSSRRLAWLTTLFGPVAARHGYDGPTRSLDEYPVPWIQFRREHETLRAMYSGLDDAVQVEHTGPHGWSLLIDQERGAVKVSGDPSARDERNRAFVEIAGELDQRLTQLERSAWRAERLQTPIVPTGEPPRARSGAPAERVKIILASIEKTLADGGASFVRHGPCEIEARRPVRFRVSVEVGDEGSLAIRVVQADSGGAEPPLLGSTDEEELYREPFRAADEDIGDHLLSWAAPHNRGYVRRLLRLFGPVAARHGYGNPVARFWGEYPSPWIELHRGDEILRVTYFALGSTATVVHVGPQGRAIVASHANLRERGAVRSWGAETRGLEQLAERLDARLSEMHGSP